MCTKVLINVGSCTNRQIIISERMVKNDDILNSGQIMLNDIDIMILFMHGSFRSSACMHNKAAHTIII